MHSAVYKGVVWHKRFEPAEHAFRYNVFMLYLDLAEIEEVLAMSRCWSTKRFAPACYRRSDFFIYRDRASSMQGQSHLSLDESVRRAVQDGIGFRPDGPIRLLTNLRYFGYIINPISCYYCFDAAERMTALLIEVTNTPWGEKTHYTLDLREYQYEDTIEFGKSMHVSPFMPMEVTYRWQGKAPGTSLCYSLENHSLAPEYQGNGMQRKFAAGVMFEREELTASGLNRILLHYPFMTVKVAVGIYWQALRLAIKRVPFVPHPAR